MRMKSLDKIKKYLPKNRTKSWKESVLKFEALEEELYSMLPVIPQESVYEAQEVKTAPPHAIPLETLKEEMKAASLSPEIEISSEELQKTSDGLEMEILTRFSSLGYKLSHLKNDSVDGYFRLSFVLKTRGLQDKDKIQFLIQQIKFDHEEMEINLYRFSKDTTNRLVRIEVSMRREKTGQKDLIHGDV